MIDSKLAPESLRDTLSLLFREAFEGKAEDKDYTWFVQGREGLFEALDQCDATVASERPGPTCSTIGAHFNHVRYALWLGNAYARGESPKGEWEASWAKQSFSPEEWSKLRADVRAEYDEMLRWYEANVDFSDPETLTGSVAQVAHMAYHLGAIRQLLKI